MTITDFVKENGGVEPIDIALSAQLSRFSKECK
jgi:hypothetical protein